MTTTIVIEQCLHPRRRAVILLKLACALYHMLYRGRILPSPIMTTELRSRFEKCVPPTSRGRYALESISIKAARNPSLANLENIVQCRPEKFHRGVGTVNGVISSRPRKLLSTPGIYVRSANVPQLHSILLLVLLLLLLLRPPSKNESRMCQSGLRFRDEIAASTWNAPGVVDNVEELGSILNCKSRHDKNRHLPILYNLNIGATVSILVKKGVID